MDLDKIKKVNSKIIKNCMSFKTIPIYGSGSQKRLDICKDNAEAILKLAYHQILTRALIFR